MNIMDTLERLFWTVVAAALVGVVAILGGADISWEQGVGVPAALAAANFLLIVARDKLSFLPNPGDGLPGRSDDS